MFHTVTIMFAGAAICIGSAVLLITIAWLIWDALNRRRSKGSF